tara:strand:- start:2846 stop:3298 length:453 start_codon:yes stop_codon:yes gene_type:complete
MASLLTDAEKATCNNAMDDLHDTFARDVTIYKDAIVTVSSASQSYNTIYGNAGATTPITYTPQSSTVSARLLYGKNYTEDYFANGQSASQLKIFLPEGEVRMIFKAADYATVSEAKRIEFDSQKFAIDSDFRAHGVFGVKFYTIYLKSVS